MSRINRFAWLLLVLCAQALAAPATMTSPANGSTLGSSQLFQWNDAGASLYQVWVGNSPGAYDIGYFPASGTMGTSTTVTGLPTDGRTLYVRLWSAIDNVWVSTDHTYMASSAAAPASIMSPTAGSTLSGSSQLFTWNAAPGATLYQLWVGNSQGAFDIGYYPATGTTGTSTMVTGLPTDGRPLHVRLWSAIGGTWVFTDLMFTAAGVGPASIVSPANGSTLAGATQLFQWNDARAAPYQLFFGSSPGHIDYGFFQVFEANATSVTATHLPTDGRMLYVRLWSTVDGVYEFRDYTYTAATVTGAAITSPADGSRLAGSTQAFQRSEVGGSYHEVWIGNAQGGSDLGVHRNVGASFTVGDLPVDGRVLYVRLWSAIDDVYHFKDYTFMAADLGPQPASLTSPAPGAVLTGTSQAFQWSDSRAENYQLWVGSTRGAYDIGFFPDAGTLGATSTTATGLPTDGRALYVRLWTLIGGTWLYRDYTYTAASTGFVAAVIFAPVPGSQLQATAQNFRIDSAPSRAGCPNTFVWNEVTIGNSPGASDYSVLRQMGYEATAYSLPAGGGTLHVRVYSTCGSVTRNATTVFRDHTFTTVSGPAAYLTNPPADFFRTGPGQTFNWNDAGATAYELWIGLTPGASDVALFQTTATSVSDPNACRGSYYRLRSLIGGVWYHRDYFISCQAA